MLDLANIDAGWNRVSKLITKKDSACAVAVAGNLFVMGGKLNGSPVAIVEKVRVGLLESV